MLETYHAALTAAGVTGYTLEMLRGDYRESLLRALLLPVWQWLRGIAPGVWWPHVEHIFTAFDDLNCAARLG